jgi:hypothetical protein
LPVHPLCGARFEVVARYGRALRVEQPDGRLRLLPVAWTDLIPRPAAHVVKGRPVRLAPEVLRELRAGVAARTRRGESPEKLDAGPADAPTLKCDAALRAEQAAAIVAELRGWAHRQRALPESSLGKAIAYMVGPWPGLTRFLEDPRVPLDNNATERGLRGVIVGRKNHYGSRSQRGTEVAALFYSLIESAKLCGVEPTAYLLRAVRAALTTPGTATLPHALLTN